MAYEPQETTTLPAVWVGVEQETARSVNTFILQLDSDRTGVFLTAGLVTAPPVVGSHEEQLEQIKSYSYVPVQPVARLMMTRRRFEELRQLMNQVVDTWPAEMEGTDA